jgi:hypothetical protein
MGWRGAEPVAYQRDSYQELRTTFPNEEKDVQELIKNTLEQVGKKHVGLSKMRPIDVKQVVAKTKHPILASILLAILSVTAIGTVFVAALVYREVCKREREEARKQILTLITRAAVAPDNASTRAVYDEIIRYCQNNGIPLVKAWTDIQNRFEPTS